MRQSRTALAIFVAASAALALGPGAAEAGRRDRAVPEREPPDVEVADEAVKYYQFGAKFFEQGLLQQARENLQRCLSLQPTYPEAHYSMALVNLELNDLPGALAEAEEALRQNPFFTEAHNVLGLAHARVGDYDAAIKEFQVVLSDVSFPTPEVAHFNIGKVMRDRGNCGEALVHFRRALELNPEFARAYRLLGDCQETMGQLEMARQSYEKCVERLPADVGPLYRLGFVCMQLKDYACAKQRFEQVRVMAPASEEATAARELLRQLNFR